MSDVRKTASFISSGWLFQSGGVLMAKARPPLVRKDPRQDLRPDWLVRGQQDV